MNCPDCGREIKQEKYSGGESYPKYHGAVDCISNLRADLDAERTKREQAEAQLAAANASLNIKAGQIIQLWHERDAALDRVKLLRGMLAIAKCPECDGSGVRQISETEAVQCQWCDERKLALSDAPPPAAKVTP